MQIQHANYRLVGSMSCGSSVVGELNEATKDSGINQEMITSSCLSLWEYFGSSVLSDIGSLSSIYNFPYTNFSNWKLSLSMETYTVYITEQ